jgi:hypothetical protein
MSAEQNNGSWADVVKKKEQVVGGQLDHQQVHGLQGLELHLAASKPVRPLGQGAS